MSDNDHETDSDASLIDLDKGSIEQFIARAKRRGVITVSELNAALPQDKMSADQIEDIMAAISAMGVNIVEDDEDDGDSEDGEAGIDRDAADADRDEDNEFDVAVGNFDYWRGTAGLTFRW